MMTGRGEKVYLVGGEAELTSEIKKVTRVCPLLCVGIGWSHSYSYSDSYFFLFEGGNQRVSFETFLPEKKTFM